MKNKKKIQLANKKQHFFNDEENFFYSFELLVTLDFFSADYDKFEPDIYWMIDWLINQYGSISINLCQYNFFADNNIVWIRKKNFWWQITTINVDNYVSKNQFIWILRNQIEWNNLSNDLLSMWMMMKNIFSHCNYYK